jgi:hypothetical protein
MSRFEVLDPTGYPPKIQGQGLNQSLSSLDGKTVFLVDVGFENSDNFMHQLGGWLADHHPSVRTEVVRWHDQHRPDPELCGRIKEHGDAAILGVGT